MSSKTKIVVLRMKELVYTGIFVALGILLILLLVYMFAPKGNGASGSADAVYTPGVYTSSITLGGDAVDISVTVSADRIESIALQNLSETVETMYPLMKPALEQLAEQICETQSLEGLTFSDDSRYTSQVLLDAISKTLEKAQISQSTQSNPKNQSAENNEGEMP